MIVNDDRCVRCGDYCGEGHIFCKPCLNELEKKYGGWIADGKHTTRNMLKPTYSPDGLGVFTDFLCEACGIRLSMADRIEIDEDGTEETHCYNYRYCPNCGRKIVE